MVYRSPLDISIYKSLHRAGESGRRGKKNISNLHPGFLWNKVKKCNKLFLVVSIYLNTAKHVAGCPYNLSSTLTGRPCKYSWRSLHFKWRPNGAASSLPPAAILNIDSKNYPVSRNHSRNEISGVSASNLKNCSKMQIEKTEKISISRNQEPQMTKSPLFLQRKLVF